MVKASQLLFEDAVQPVELDLAVSLPAIYRGNPVLRLRAGQLLVELVPRGHHQWSFALICAGEAPGREIRFAVDSPVEGAGDLRQQRRRRRVNVNAAGVDAILDHRIEGARKFVFAHIVLIFTHVKRLFSPAVPGPNRYSAKSPRSSVFSTLP